MALFILRKFILQMRMRSYPVGLDLWFLVGPFLYFHSSCVRTAKALVRLRGYAGSPEPSLVAYVISTKISWTGSNVILKTALLVCELIKRGYSNFCFILSNGVKKYVFLKWRSYELYIHFFFISRDEMSRRMTQPKKMTCAPSLIRVFADRMKKS